MWKLASPWWHFVLRGTIVYFFLLFALRLSGKRQVGQLAPFDLVLLLILSNAVQNAMNAGDDSVLAGLILATTLIAINYIVSFASFRHRKLEAVIEGQPEILIENGNVLDDILKKQKITDLELMTALRNAGCDRIADVRLAILENNGHVSVMLKNANGR